MPTFTESIVNIDPKVLLAAIDRNKSTFVPTDNSRLALASLPHTKQHEFLIKKVTNNFLSALANVPNGKWSDLLQPVKFKTLGGKITHPKNLALCGGGKTPTKVIICNKALINWMVVMKKIVNRCQTPVVQAFLAYGIYPT